MSKTKKAKLPKRIGGVKIPKELREAGGALLEKANSPAGREMLAAGLTMAAAAATAAVQKQRGAHRFSAAPAPPRPPETPEAPHATRAGEPGIGDPQALADAIGNAADAVLTRLFGAKKPG